MGLHKTHKYLLAIIFMMLTVIINGCATQHIFEKQNGPHEVKINISGIFNQIYYIIEKLDNDKFYNVTRTLCIPINFNNADTAIDEQNRHLHGVKYLIIRNDLFDSVLAANNNTDRYKLLLSKHIDLKSVEVIHHVGKLTKGWYIYLTYDYLTNETNDLKPLYPNMKFALGEIIPNDVIMNNYVVNSSNSIKQHGSYYAYLVRHGQGQVEASIKNEFDYFGYEKLLPDDNHLYTINVMDSEAVYKHSALARYSLAPFAFAVDLAASPFYLLMFSTIEHWAPR